MRRRGVGLVGTMARTAVVAGTATAVAGNVASRQQQSQPQAAPAPAPQEQPAAAPVAADPYAEIEKLGSLKDQGYLTEDEFQAKKRQILGL
ncbi:SHOCT domain-containing protein [Candidatus Saccharibacteria bacterium]|nr:SHOCT domain-containing protein [Candidatus Saccharibacteria bacterium]